MAKAMVQPGLVDATHVAERLGGSPRYVRRLVVRRIRYVKVGHLVRFYPEDVEALIEAAIVHAIPDRRVTMPSAAGLARHRSAGSRPPRRR